ncbi:MAG: RNA methyltransferase [Bacteroidales bacterium]|nr:RNA methyltransferase [Bacteroidales bacterium]
MKEKLILHLEQFITERRLQSINRVLAQRTRYITVVLEDIFQSHNASAVLRSCDCFGIQDVHIIENRNTYQVNPDVALGSYKWLNLYKYNKEGNNTVAALEKLKKQGYRLVATTPHQKGSMLEDFDLNKGKLALVFGTELEGLTDNASCMADEVLTIPMVGFTESLNISVTAAVILHDLTRRLRKSTIPWQLSQDEILQIKLQWLKNSIRRSDTLEKTFTDNQ